MILIKNAMLYTMDTIDGENGFIAIKNQKIEAIGTILDEKQYQDYQVLDAKGAMLTPGLVDPHCHIGVMEEGIQFEGNDTNETTNPIYPELRGIDSVYPHDRAFLYTAKSGVTTVVTGPGSANVIGGTFTALKTVGNTVDEMIFKEEVCMKMALGENPKRVYSSQKRNPSTRMASAALAREWLQKAKDYHQELKAYESNKEDAKKPVFDAKLHSLMRVFEGMKVKIHAHRSDDIMTAIRIAKEYDLDMTIDHGTEAYLIPEEVKNSGYPVILGPTLTYASKYELINRSFTSAKVLEEHGVLFAIMTDHPIVTLDMTRVQVALFVKAGLSKKSALKAITINAAKLNGLDDRVGSLAVGKDADLVLWNGDIFDIMVDPLLVMINGQIVHQV